MKNYKVAVVAGDGIGPEIVAEGVKVLKKAADKFGANIEFNELLAGGCAIDAHGEALPQSTIDACRESDAIFLGAIGGYKWDNLPGMERPEMAILGLRKEFGLFANLRPANVFKELKGASPLKDEIVEAGIDIMVVRELNGGIYFGEKGRRDVNGEEQAYDIKCYTEREVKRIAKVAFEAAMKRDKKLTSIDKANVLESSRLWRATVIEMAKDYPEVTLEHMYIDNAAMQLVRNPAQFDVILTGNMFGDIISDEASMITGSIGMLASSSVRGDKFGMYEPIHGSAPDIAGQQIANPIAQILSGAMMLRYSLDMPEAADAIEKAVESVLAKGFRTADIFTEGTTKVGTVEMGDLIAKEL